MLPLLKGGNLETFFIGEGNPIPHSLTLQNLTFYLFNELSHHFQNSNSTKNKHNHIPKSITNVCLLPHTLQHNNNKIIKKKKERKRNPAAKLTKMPSFNFFKLHVSLSMDSNHTNQC